MKEESKEFKEIRKRISYGLNESHDNEEKYLKNLERSRNFDPIMQEKGLKEGLLDTPFDQIPLEYRENVYFKAGYERGQRLRSISSQTQSSKKRG